MTNQQQQPTKWYQSKWKVGAVVIIALILIGSLVGKKEGNTASANNDAPAKTYVKLGEKLSTKYFDVTVNDAKVRKEVKTGNQFADRKPEDGNSFMILNVTFKNTDSESRMITDGEILINYNGKDYKFDKSETIMLEGWGILLDQINPLTSKTTNIVYKIPSEIKGMVYYRPGRANSDDLIAVGTID